MSGIFLTLSAEKSSTNISLSTSFSPTPVFEGTIISTSSTSVLISSFPFKLVPSSDVKTQSLTFSSAYILFSGNTSGITSALWGSDTVDEPTFIASLTAILDSPSHVSPTTASEGVIISSSS
ncbi:hypothetical protein AAHE18_11G222100 [Arachis hypogaea]